MTKRQVELIQEQVTACTEQLTRADNMQAGQAQIGALILAIGHLADAVEKLNKRVQYQAEYTDAVTAPLHG